MEFDDYPFTEEKDIPIEIPIKKSVKEIDIKQAIQDDPSPKDSLSALCCGVKNDLHEFEKYILTMGSPSAVLSNMKTYHSAKLLSEMRGLESKSGFGKMIIIILLVVVLLGILLLFAPELMKMMSGTGGF